MNKKDIINTLVKEFGENKKDMEKLNKEELTQILEERKEERLEEEREREDISDQHPNETLESFLDDHFSSEF